jgi:hypothetical protein
MAPAWLEKFIVREDPSPDPRRTSSEKPALKLQYQSLADHRRILTVDGEQTETPLYEVTRKTVLGARGSKCSITANEREVAVIQYKTFSY